MFWLILYRNRIYAPVAQLDRAFGYEPKGHIVKKFENLIE